MIVSHTRWWRRAGGGMREAELRKLIVEEFLGFIEDTRIERTRKHSLENILVISLLGVICGADSFVAIEEFGKAKKAWLTSFLDLETIPSHDTIGRVFAALDARALAEAFQRWTMAMAANSGEKLIAIDGKALRRSFRQAGDSAFVHMVSAWSVSNHVVLGQVKTDEKSNEITAIPQLLALLDIKDALVTIDAAGAQTSIADTIIEKDGDYLLALKGNQPTLHDALIQHFTGHGSGHRDFDYFEVSERGHGREEIRRAWVSTAVGELDRALRWRGLATLVRIEAVRTTNQSTSREDRYFICSRATFSAAEALGAVRSHWGIENQLHWVLDVAFREDDCRVRAGNAAANFSAVRQLALGLLKQRTEKKVGIKNKRLAAGWDQSFLLRVIGLNA
jgi:predicted transposase YbfD/YdcC